MQYNGGSAISLNAGAWTDVVTSGGGTLSKLEINGGSIDAALSAIEIDGKTITNPFIYGADVTVSPAVADWSGGGGPERVFSDPPDLDNTFTVTTDVADSFIEWNSDVYLVAGKFLEKTFPLVGGN